MFGHLQLKQNKLNRFSQTSTILVIFYNLQEKIGQNIMSVCVGGVLICKLHQTWTHTSKFANQTRTHLPTRTALDLLLYPGDRK